MPQNKLKQKVEALTRVVQALIKEIQSNTINLFIIFIEFSFRLSRSIFKPMAKHSR